MSNFLRVGAFRIPTAAYTKSLEVSIDDQREFLALINTALNQKDDLSKHQAKRLRLEKKRYHRILYKHNQKVKAKEEKYQQETSYLQKTIDSWYDWFAPES